VSRTPALLALPPAEAAERVLTQAGDDWTRAFLDELDRRVRIQPLARLLALWDLSGAGAARLFGVSRQAFAKWLEHGPPADRVDTVAALAAATDTLERYVKRENIPAVVRRAAPALGGRSLLQLAQSGRAEEVLRRVQAMFDLRRVQP
jgi:hypothetical protein